MIESGLYGSADEPAILLLDAGLRVSGNNRACLHLLGNIPVPGQSLECFGEHWQSLAVMLQNGTIAYDSWHETSVGQQLLLKATKLTGTPDKYRWAIIIQSLQPLNSEVENSHLLTHQARFAAMGEMIAAIAHQWRQPLATISALVQNIRAAYRIDRLDANFLEQTVSKAMEQCTYLSETLEEFRTYFRPEKTPERFNVREAIEDAVWLILPQLQSVGISLSAKGGEFPPIYAVGYPNEFKQVLLNLICNARDAIEEQKQELRKAHDSKIEISLDNVGEHIRISVVDNGIGIHTALRERIFEPYFTTKEESKGTGIGLYMSRMIIETGMGGSLSLDKDHQQTCFVIKLPGDA